MRKWFIAALAAFGCWAGGSAALADGAGQVTKLVFFDTNEEPGKIGGAVEFTPPGDLTGITAFSLYFTDASGKKLTHLYDIDTAEAEAALDELRAKGAKVSTYRYGISARAVPEGVTHLGVFAKYGERTADQGTLTALWDNPTEMVEGDFLSAADIEPASGAIRYKVTWQGLDDEKNIKGYVLKYESRNSVGTEPNSYGFARAPQPIQGGTAEKRGDGHDYELTLPAGAVPADAYRLWLYPVSRSGELGFGVTADLQEDISGTAPKALTPTSGIPYPSESLFDEGFVDFDETDGSIGGKVSWNILYGSRNFDERLLETGATPLRFAAYFADKDGKKLKGLYAVDRALDELVIPNGTKIPAGAVYIGVFAELGTAESVEKLLIPLWDVGTSGYHPKEFVQWDSDARGGKLKARLTWKPAVNEAQFDEYVVLVGQKKEPYAVLPAGKTSYELMIEDDDFFNETLTIVAHKAQDPVPEPDDMPEHAFVTDLFDWEADRASGRWQLEADEPITLALKDEDPGRGTISFALPWPDRDYIMYTWLDVTRRRGESLGNVMYLLEGQSPSTIRLPAGTPIPSGAVFLEVDNQKVEGSVIYAVRDAVGTAPRFTDVAPDAKEAEAISTLAALGVVTGFEDGTFRGGDPVTRAQFASLLTRAFRLHTDYPGLSNLLKDVKQDAWYADAVDKVFDNKLMQGNEARQFLPEASITRAELAVTLARLLPYAGPAYAEGAAAPAFDDAADIPAWAADSVGRLQAAGVLAEGGTFGPSAKATRAEVAYMLERTMRLFGLVE